MRARWLPRVVLILVAIYLLIAIPVGLRQVRCQSLLKVGPAV
jgi:hypothetical protein